MFKQISITALAMAAMTSARRLRCNGDDGETCMQVTRDTADGQCIPIFQDDRVELQLSTNELWGTKKSGHWGRCFWRLEIPDPDNEGMMIPIDDDYYDFGCYEVSQLGWFRNNKFEVEVKAEGTAGAHYELNFINSCDVRPDEDDVDEDDVDEEDEEEYNNPLRKKINIMILAAPEDEEEEGNEDDVTPPPEEDWKLKLLSQP